MHFYGFGQKVCFCIFNGKICFYSFDIKVYFYGFQPKSTFCGFGKKKCVLEVLAGKCFFFAVLAGNALGGGLAEKCFRGFRGNFFFFCGFGGKIWFWWESVLFGFCAFLRIWQESAFLPFWWEKFIFTVLTKKCFYAFGRKVRFYGFG